MPLTAIPIGFTAGVAADVDGTTFRAASVQLKPAEPGGNGHFSVGLSSGIMAAALGANSEIVQFRWSDAFRFAVIRKIRFDACVSTTFFAAGVPLQFDMLKANAWTAAGSGGNRITPAALLKKRTSHSTTLMAASDVGCASTAALTAGTKTLEGTPMQAIVAPGPITLSLNGQIVEPGTIFWQAEVGDGEHPLVLHQNEGFVIRAVAVPITGTWSFRCQIDWAEVDSY